MVVSGGSSPSSGASWTGRAAKPRPLVLAVHAHALAGNGQLGAGGVCCGATTACQSASTQQGLGQLSRDCTGAHHGLGRPRCKQPQLPQPPGQQVRHLQLPSPPHPSGNPWWCKWPFLLPFSRWTRSPIPALSSSQRRRRPGRPATVLGADSRSHGCVPCHAVLWPSSFSFSAVRTGCAWSGVVAKQQRSKASLRLRAQARCTGPWRARARCVGRRRRLPSRTRRSSPRAGR